MNLESFGHLGIQPDAPDLGANPEMNLRESLILTGPSRDVFLRLLQRSRNYPPEVSLAFIFEPVSRNELDTLLNELEELHLAALERPRD